MTAGSVFRASVAKLKGGAAHEDDPVDHAVKAPEEADARCMCFSTRFSSKTKLLNNHSHRSLIRF